MNHDYNQLFSDLAADGLRINNLFQLDSGHWRCNLRDDRFDTKMFTYGEGPDPYLAVLAAWGTLETNRGVPPRRSHPVATAEQVGFNKPGLSSRVRAFLGRASV